MSSILEQMCLTHRAYEGKLKPRATCLQCWLGWLKAHPGVPVNTDDLRAVVEAVIEHCEEYTVEAVNQIEFGGDE